MGKRHGYRPGPGSRARLDAARSRALKAREGPHAWIPKRTPPRWPGGPHPERAPQEPPEPEGEEENG